VSTVDGRIGTELAGYRIERLLGRGGMSRVYLAEHVRLHRHVALKLLAPELAHDERFRERFLRESQLAASLDHPNVVPIYDADEVDGVLYIAMRWVEGFDLRELLRLHAPLEPVRALAIVAQAAAGLDAAHRRGLVHRDVKPGNILIGEDEHVYVSDFGLTKQASSQTGLTATGQLVGTLDYVAPEQIQGQQVDGRTDLYSLSCVLYESLTGARPFERDSEVAILWAHMQDAPPPASEKRPELPKELDDVLTRGMAKTPAERYATCRELVDAARRALGISSGELPQPVVMKRVRLDRRLLAAAVVAAVVIAAVAGVLLTRGGNSGVSALPLNAVGAIDPKTNKLVASIPVGKTPVDVAVGFGSVWVANQDDGTISRISASSRTVDRTIGITGTPLALAVGSGYVWATTEQGGLFRIDPASADVAQIPVRVSNIKQGFFGGTTNTLTGIVAGAGSIWLLWADGGRALRLDPTTGAVVRRIPDETSPTGIAFGNGALWLSELASVSRVDPLTDTLTGTAQVGALQGLGSTTVAAGGGSVWVAKSESGDVWQVSPNGPTAVGRIAVGPNVGHIAVGQGGVWVARPKAGQVVRIDPRTGRLRTIAVGTGAYAVATGAGLVWVTTVGGTPHDVSIEGGGG
jgi:YVTN family beta-propeller protein